MEWNVIYIVGNPGFKKEVSKKLEHSDLDFMPGYLGSASGMTDHDMYWVDKAASLRSFKEAIGGKIIWKYRVKFFVTLEEFVAYQNNDSTSSSLTDHDKALMEEMRKS